MYPRVAQFKTAAALRARLAELGCELPLDDEPLTAAASSPLAEPLAIGPRTVGNRWCIHPMEGWDARPDGFPSELTLRRWQHFGESGAKLIWGGEAAAVQPDGRANPRQTLATPAHRSGLEQLLSTLRAAHWAEFGRDDDLLVGLQLTHSGRFSKPVGPQLAPRIAYHHPLLDARFGLAPHDDSVVWTDDALDELVETYVAAAQTAAAAGYDFVDVKCCHGYLLHEFLSARARPGKYGGDYAGRTRLLRTIVARIRSDAPGLLIGVRLSAFDTVPYRPGQEVGQPLDYAHLLPYEHAFGARADDPLQFDLTEAIQLVRDLASWGVCAVNVSCGSPYYCPHLMRPAAFPPSDGYQPPEDPLVGVARQVQAVRTIKQAAPHVPLVGTGYSYLQDYLPHAAQALVRAGWVDSVGLGRMVLSYPHLPRDVLRTGRLARKLVCRTFSDCTTAPRNGIVSGCYPLDAYYKSLPEAEQLRAAKAR